MATYDLSGKTAFVTGATSGLGHRFASVLASAGARVAIAGRRADRLGEVKDEIEGTGARCTAIGLDVTDDARIAPAVDEAERELGGIDILVNNAGMNLPGLVLERSIGDFDTVLKTDLRAPFVLAREVGSRMIARGNGGRIINVASIGSHRVLPGSTAYCVAKAGLVTLTQCLAREWARHSINVNAICPGYVETGLNSPWFGTEKGQEQIRTFPKRRLMQAEGLDEVFLLLASDGSRAITGALLAVDEAQSL